MKFFKTKQNNPPKGRVAFMTGPEGTQVSYANSDGNVVFCRSATSRIDTTESIAHMVEEYGWLGKPCTLVLHPQDYQLLLTDAPKVPEEELNEAIRWKVKDLLSYPVTEAAICAFGVPDDAYHGRRNVIYAAALPKQKLENLVAPFRESGLLLDRIEICELAMHQALQRSIEPGDSVALMTLLRKDGMINLVEQCQLYLSRRMSTSVTALTEGEGAALESLLLELQRSLDYYESQMGKGVIKQIFYAPAIAELEIIERYIRQHVKLNIAPAPLPVAVSMELDPFDTARCYPTIGAALGPLIEVTG